MIIQMRAAVLNEYGQRLSIEDLEIKRPPHAGEVLIRIKAAGVCHSDLYVLDGSTPVPPPPVVPGHEAIGVVEEVGSGVDNIQPGDYVVTSFIWPCGRCRNCIRGKENLCERFSEVRLRGGYYLTARHTSGGKTVRRLGCF